MELTPQEQRICNVFRRPDGTGKIQCYECPLNKSTDSIDCKINPLDETSKDVESL